MNEDKAKRWNEILARAAEALADGRDPFTREWLSKHEITLDECFRLSDMMAVLLKGYLASSKEDQNKILILGAASGVEGMDPKVFRTSLEMVLARKKLRAFSQK